MIPTASGNNGTSTRPYLVRALHDWCTDNGFTPYIAVFVDDSVQVPREYVKNNEIVLNVGFEATSGLKMGNEYIEFKARFGGSSREIVVPVDHVIAIYARENGQGMAFPAPTEPHEPSGEAEDADVSVTSSAAADAGGGGHPGKPGAGGGLRLASADGQAAPGAASAPGGEEADAAAAPTGEGNEPEPPAPGGGGRPSLKRIK